jgi:hypothetical protein
VAEDDAVVDALGEVVRAHGAAGVGEGVRCQQGGSDSCGLREGGGGRKAGGQGHGRERACVRGGGHLRRASSHETPTELGGSAGSRAYIRPLGTERVRMREISAPSFHALEPFVALVCPTPPQPNPCPPRLLFGAGQSVPYSLHNFQSPISKKQLQCNRAPTLTPSL